jgi:hypothetical protein
MAAVETTPAVGLVRTEVHLAREIDVSEFEDWV